MALIDAPTGDLFRNNRMVEAMSSALLSTGHGLLIHERFGVNRAISALSSASVPAASVLRIIDAERDQGAIRRNLDRAALDASKTGSAIVYGRSYPETISALSIWSLSNAARGVVFAPLTATMRKSQQGI